MQGWNMEVKWGCLLIADFKCYCGNLLSSSAKGATCNMPCSGDSSSTCGGSYALNVYQISFALAPTTTSSTSSTVASTSMTSATPSSTSLGCYQDSPTRLLSGSLYTASNMTSNACISYCSQLGFNYAGLEYGQEVNRK
jgi:hypothetical protein